MEKRARVFENFTAISESLALAGLQVVFGIFDGDYAIITTEVTIRYIVNTGKYIVVSDARTSRYSNSTTAIRNFLRQAVSG